MKKPRKQKEKLIPFTEKEIEESVRQNAQMLGNEFILNSVQAVIRHHKKKLVP